METLIGAGGWAYFDVPRADRLAAYARAFPFVEVNSTFYAYPHPRTVASWRRRAPRTFRFAVRAHRDLTHRLRATSAARASWIRTAKIAAALEAVAIVIETPPSLRFARPGVRDLENLLAATSPPCPVGLEARAYAGRSLPKTLTVAMEAHDIADVVDFSRQAPRTEASHAYGRMFGLGKGNRWEFTDDELRRVRDRPQGRDLKRVAYTFHGVRMYKDGARFLTFVRTGRFPMATRGAGLGSLAEVLGEDTRFPVTKADLIEGQGWRVVDLKPDHRVHAQDLLQDLPTGTYSSVAAVVQALEHSAGPP